MFCYLGKFGQAVLWPNLPDWATKKKRKLLQPDRPVSQNFISINTTKASLNKSLAFVLEAIFVKNPFEILSHRV